MSMQMNHKKKAEVFSGKYIIGGTYSRIRCVPVFLGIRDAHCAGLFAVPAQDQAWYSKLPAPPKSLLIKKTRLLQKIKFLQQPYV